MINSNKAISSTFSQNDFCNLIQKTSLELFTFWKRFKSQEGAVVNRGLLWEEIVILVLRTLILSAGVHRKVLHCSELTYEIIVDVVKGGQSEPLNPGLVNLCSSHLFSSNFILIGEDFFQNPEPHSFLLSLYNLVESGTPLEFIGAAFENLYEQIPHIEGLSTKKQNGNRQKRDEGVFYTPVDIADFLTVRTLQPLINNKSGKEILSLKILDPSCGAGYFLLQALRLLSNAFNSSLELNSEIKRDIFNLVAHNCIYGVDINPLSVDITRSLLWLEVADPLLHPSFLDENIKVGDGLLGLPCESVEIEGGKEAVNDYTTNLNESSEEVFTRLKEKHSSMIFEILQRRYKLPKTSEPLIKPFCWEINFPGVFLDEHLKRIKNGGFDAVLSNPPWGKIKPDLREFYSYFDSRVLQHQGMELREFLKNDELILGIEDDWQSYVLEKKIYSHLLREIGIYNYQKVRINGISTGGDADLYKYFMERYYQVLKPLGRLGVVIPAAFYNTQGATGLRNLYLKGGEFEDLLCFENRKRIFPIHRMFKFLLLVYQKGSEAKGIKTALFGLTSLETAKNKLSNGKEKSINFPLPFIKRISGVLLSVPELRDNTEKNLLVKFHQRFITLGELSKDSWNISFVREVDMTNDSKAFFSREELIRLGCKKESNGFLSSPQGDVFRPVFEGRMVNQFDYCAKGYLAGAGRSSEWEPLSWEQRKSDPTTIYQQLI